MRPMLKPLAVVGVICLAIFNVCAFVIPNPSMFSPTFWMGYSVITVAFIGEFVIAYLGIGEDIRKGFYSLASIIVGFIGLIAISGVGIAMIAIPSFLLWHAIVICALMLGVSAIVVIVARAAGRAAQSIDDQVEKSTHTIRSLCAEAEHLTFDARSPACQTEAKRVFAAIRYSDPTSNFLLHEVDERIARQFDIFSDAIRSGDQELSHAEADTLLSLIDSRAVSCKSHK